MDTLVDGFGGMALAEEPEGTGDEVAVVEDYIPGSAVELCREGKLVRKLEFRRRVEEEVKFALGPYFNSRRVNKDEYKTIMRKVVPKICRSRSGTVDPPKIARFVRAYVNKCRSVRKRGVFNCHSFT